MSDKVPLQSNPDWKNWTEDLVHLAAPSGKYYYFSPRNRAELQKIVKDAAIDGVQVRVSGQRHSQPPLVINNVREDPSYKSNTWLVDLSCYADLGVNGDEQLIADVENKTVTVNAGVREDYLDAYLATKNLILRTVTAGGFFSLGGMTAVDVHGATIGAPIFSETVVSFSVMGADGEVTVIDESTPGVDGWNAIQFARVSLGALGIVTSMTISVLERKYKTTLSSGIDRVTLTDQSAFVAKFLQLFKDHQRVESFFDPYNNDFLILWWDIHDDLEPPQPANFDTNSVPTACKFASENSFGAPYEGKVEEWFTDHLIEDVQYLGTRKFPMLAIGLAFKAIVKMFGAAKKKATDLWLSQAARTGFISYFIEIPGLNEEGLATVWQALQKVPERLDLAKDFFIAGPMEFRFIKGGDSALSGAYSENKDAYFANLDVIGFVKRTSVEEYPSSMLDFFAAIERSWYGDFKGMPHNGKMYGFFDPSASGNASTPPFNPGFLKDVASRRGDRLTAFNAFREQRDPDGRFGNDFLRASSIGTEVD